MLVYYKVLGPTCNSRDSNARLAFLPQFWYYLWPTPFAIDNTVLSKKNGTLFGRGFFRSPKFTRIADLSGSVLFSPFFFWCAGHLAFTCAATHINTNTVPAGSSAYTRELKRNSMPWAARGDGAGGDLSSQRSFHLRSEEDAPPRVTAAVYLNHRSALLL